MFKNFDRLLRKYGLDMKLWSNKDDEKMFEPVPSHREFYYQWYGYPVDLVKVWRDREVFMETREDQE